jgi:hypothetical protein
MSALRPRSVRKPACPSLALRDNVQAEAAVLCAFGADGKVTHAFTINALDDRRDWRTRRWTLRAGTS